MNKNNGLTFTGRIRSLRCAACGVGVVVASQRNAWVHAAATAAVACAALCLGVTRAEWCWLILAVVSVWAAEALNTAFEFLTDLASPEFHPLAAKAKDVAAGAVLITAVGSALVGVVVFAPYVLRGLGSP